LLESDAEIIEGLWLTSWDGEDVRHFCGWKHVERHLNALLVNDQ
jgi:hypothetical protein